MGRLCRPRGGGKAPSGSRRNRNRWLPANAFLCSHLQCKLPDQHSAARESRAAGSSISAPERLEGMDASTLIHKHGSHRTIDQGTQLDLRDRPDRVTPGSGKFPSESAVKSLSDSSIAPACACRRAGDRESDLAVVLEAGQIGKPGHFGLRSTGATPYWLPLRSSCTWRTCQSRQVRSASGVDRQHRSLPPGVCFGPLSAGGSVAAETFPCANAG